MHHFSSKSSKTSHLDHKNSDKSPFLNASQKITKKVEMDFPSSCLIFHNGHGIAVPLTLPVVS